MASDGNGYTIHCASQPQMTLERLLCKRNCLVALVLMFIAMAVWVGTVPYEPMKMDLADATANFIWTENYSKGVYDIPYSEWNGGQTQCVVVLHDGQYVVVNEKGPGLGMMIAAFQVVGAEFLFAPFIVGLAVLSTYMFGMRIAGWKVGVLAAMMTMANLVVIVMWHRYYWTDAATMHLLVLSLWLLVEANYHYNGSSLDPRSENTAGKKGMGISLVCALLSGLSFAAAVSTRYPAALLIAAMMFYLFAFYILRAWPELKRRDVAGALRKAKGLFVLILFFAIGLMMLLAPLMQYNATYFGGPFASGYDATPLNNFNRTHALDVRNATGSWFETIGQGIVNSVANGLLLIPTFISRMPALVFLPLGIWLLRRNIVLALLIPWLAIAFFTYLSLSWIAMYARIGWENVWEPRYFMPVIPVLSIFGAVAISRISFKKLEFKGAERKKLLGAAIALLMAGTIVLCGIAPAEINFSHVRSGQYQTPHGGQPPGGQPGPGGNNTQPPNIIVLNVTTDQLLINPQSYGGRFVHLDNATVINTLPKGLVVRSWNATRQDGVRIVFDGWPNGSTPSISIGREVEVKGIFNGADVPDPILRYAIGVKYQTTDYVRVKP
ncbi:MAG: hypothetical protein HZB92_02600 [Euryarchaeota archaeon]|nr:hypothetical protein [Euryarchaeota archaeon]